MEVVASGGLEPVFHAAAELAAGRNCVLCLVIDTIGSTPQVKGAMMACDLAGRTVGTIGGGGCLEAQVKRQSWDLLLNGGFCRLDLSLDHDVSVKDGMICGGSMTVIAVNLCPESAQIWQDACALINAGQEADLPLNFDSETSEGRIALHLVPDPVLIIAGAGHVGVEVAWVAARIGFAVTIIDDRPELTVSARFPEKTTALCGNIPELLARMPLRASDYVVIATRGHRDDLDALVAVASRPLKYLGLLGSRRKIITLFKELRHLGVKEPDLQKIFTPIGLGIGAQTPSEIAVAIGAQLVMIRRIGITPGLKKLPENEAP